MEEGIPSTKINRRSFLTASLRSAADRTLDDDFGKAKILLNDFAVSEVEGLEDIYCERNLEGISGVCLKGRTTEVKVNTQMTTVGARFNHRGGSRARPASYHCVPPAGPYVPWSISLYRPTSY